MEYLYYEGPYTTKYVVREEGKVKGLAYKSKLLSYSVGDIVLVRIQKAHASGYFALLPDGSEGFMSTDSKYSDGSLAKVSVKRLPREDKGYLLTDKTTVKSELLIYDMLQTDVSYSRNLSTETVNWLQENINPKPGFTFRSIVEKADFDTVQKSYNHMLSLCSEIERQSATAMNPKLLYSVFEGYEKLCDPSTIAAIEEEIYHYGLLSSIVCDGVRITFDKATALSCIDIDSHKSGKSANEVNRKAMDSILEMILWRGYYGILIVDFLKGAQVNPGKLPKGMRFHGLTNLGLGQFTVMSDGQSVYDIGIDKLLIESAYFKTKRDLSHTGVGSIKIRVDESLSSLTNVGSELESILSAKVYLEYSKGSDVIEISYVK